MGKINRFSAGIAGALVMETRMTAQRAPGACDGTRVWALGSRQVVQRAGVPALSQAPGPDCWKQYRRLTPLQELVPLFVHPTSVRDVMPTVPLKGGPELLIQKLQSCPAQVPAAVAPVQTL